MSQYRNRFFPNSQARVLYTQPAGQEANATSDTPIVDECEGRMTITTNGSWVGTTILGTLKFLEPDSDTVTRSKPSTIKPEYVIQLRSADAWTAKLYLDYTSAGIVIKSVGAGLLASKSYSFNFISNNFNDFEPAT